MQADELATARERDTNLRVEALEFNPKAIRVFTSSDSSGHWFFSPMPFWEEIDYGPGGCKSQENL